MSRSIFDYIMGSLPDRRVHFVFPSAVAADFWAAYAAEVSLEPLGPARFIAWDTFKAAALSVSLEGMEAVNRGVRTLFASRLLEENARKGAAFLTDYINPLYAGSYNGFVNALTKLLPALQGVLRRFAEIPQDPYFRDLYQIYRRYKTFLESRALYEPAWNRAAFACSDKRWLLFFPELSEDWEEYREELAALASEGGHIEIVPLEGVGPPVYQGDSPAVSAALGNKGGRWIPFPFAGEEYRWLALTIRRLLDESRLAPEDIAVSVPGSADMDRLIQELHRYDLPVNRRQGRTLPEYPGGRIFAALAACPSSRWSFKALKNLLLDKAFPWKDTGPITALLDFGLRFRCVSGFIEGRREIDVWERTFDRRLKPRYERLKKIFPLLPQDQSAPEIQEIQEIEKALEAEIEKRIENRIEKKTEKRAEKNPGNKTAETEKALQRAARYFEALTPGAAPEALENISEALDILAELGAAVFYEGLKKDIAALVSAPTFTGLERNWHYFEARYFDKTRFHLETDRIIARAISALEELAGIESRFPELAGGAAEGSRPFAVFQSYIQEERYVFQSETAGISVYDYRVAAGIGPAAHFIVNMTQEAAAVVYSGGASFLREDRRRALGILDQDLSAEFLRAYRFSGAFPVFTLSLKTFAGPAIPHRSLSVFLGPPAAAPLFPDDPYLAEASLAAGKDIPRAVPVRVQRKAWEALKILRSSPRPLDLRKEPVPEGLLRAALADRLGSGNATRLSRCASALKQDKIPRVSPTFLNEYRACPFKWALERGLLIKEKQTEIKTIDQKELGKLYHRILERLFIRIKAETGRFFQENIAAYKAYLREETGSALEDARRREGAFQESVYAMLEPRITAALEDYLDHDLPALAGAKILGAEYPLQKAYGPEDPLLAGTADLALEDPDGGLTLTDFKTGRIPTKKELLSQEGNPPQDLQMAAYIAMIEDNDRQGGGEKIVRTARFYSIDTRRFCPVVSEREEKESKRLSRKSYEHEVAAVARMVGAVGEAMKTGAYMVPAKADPGQCRTCGVSSICRMPF
ncbi:MAG: PD-(D/E)XK nuclease family protein [Spirochaetaceae bacterium]|jgi:hypothetical protein|nr:PD-(D/E)XK nuclease family protein [Spirochaetaceae bacterium]